MVYVGNKKFNSKYFIISCCTTLIAAICILKVGGLAATIATIVYCILLGITVLGIFEQIFKPKVVGMKIGMAVDPNTNRVVMDMSRYNQFISTYEHRFSSMWFWLDIPITMGWVVIFLVAGFSMISYIVVAVYMSLEIGKYEIYKAIKENKDEWATATTGKKEE